MLGIGCEAKIFTMHNTREDQKTPFRPDCVRLHYNGMFEWYRRRTLLYHIRTIQCSLPELALCEQKPI